MPEPIGKSSYSVWAVSFAELLRAIGVELQRARLARKWRPTDVEKRGGPSYKTVQAIEDGEPGHVESLEKCAKALDLSIVDVFYAVLASGETPLSPEAAHLVQKFSETTIAGRQALLAMANALPPADGAVKPRAPRRSRPVRPAAKPRTDE